MRHAFIQLEGTGNVTALLAAAVLGNERAARLLLQHGADIEARDEANGWTPLLHAIYNRSELMAGQPYSTPSTTGES